MALCVWCQERDDVPAPEDVDHICQACLEMHDRVWREEMEAHLAEVDPKTKKLQD